MCNLLQRYYGRGDLHFITFSCYRRQRYLGAARARDRFVKILGQVRARYGFQLLGYVVMPEHVHLTRQRTQERHSFPRVTGVEAEGFTRLATTAEKRQRATLLAVWLHRERSPGLLAAPLLRFQRVEQRKAAGETQLHAPQSGAAETRQPSEGLAVEQLVALRKGRARNNCNRYSA